MGVDWLVPPADALREKDVGPSKAHYEDVFACISRNFGKGFLLGYGGKVIELLVRVRGRMTFAQAFNSFFRSKESTRWGVFLGLLLAIFNGILHATRDRRQLSERHAVTLRGRVLNLLQNYRVSIAGALAGLSILALPRQTRTTVAIFIGVRALEIQAKLAVRRGLVPAIPHADVLLMVLSGAEVMWAWLFRKDTIESSYRGFLARHSQIHKTQVDAVRKVFAGSPIDLESYNQFLSARGLPAVHDPYFYNKQGGYAMLMHPAQSYVPYTIAFFGHAVRLALSVYVPVFAISQLLWSPGRMLTKPLPTAKRMITDIFRSSFFLASYTTAGIASLKLWNVLGITYENLGDWSQVALALAGATGGLSLFIEKPSRRIEVALLVCRQAVHSLFALVHAKPLLPWRGLAVLRSSMDVVFFCLAMCHILHAFVHYPHLVRYHSLLTRFFDSPESRHNLFSPKGALTRSASGPCVQSVD